MPAFEWFRKVLTRKPLALSGAPAIRRRKTYSASSGYAYQYYYQGSRLVPGGREYVFEVSSGRGASFGVSVILKDEAIEPWEVSHNRTLVAQERFAIAKLSLKRAFDDTESPELMRRPISPQAEMVASILSMLSVD